MVNSIHFRAYSGDKIIHSAIKCRINNIRPISIFELLLSTKKSTLTLSEIYQTVLKSLNKLNKKIVSSDILFIVIYTKKS